MEYCLTTRLDGNIAMTSAFHLNRELMEDRSLYKFIWVQQGFVDVEIDHKCRFIVICVLYSL